MPVTMKKSPVRRQPLPAPKTHLSAPATAPVTPPIDAGPTRFSWSVWARRAVPAWIVLPLRLFLGATFVYAGIQKLTDPQYFRASAPGYIGKQITGFAAGSPIGGFLHHVIVPHALLFGGLIAWGELAIGLGVLVGLLVRPAAFFGALL